MPVSMMNMLPIALLAGLHEPYGTRRAGSRPNSPGMSKKKRVRRKLEKQGRKNARRRK